MKTSLITLEQGTMSSVTEKGEVKTCPTKKMTWRIDNYSKVMNLEKLSSKPVLFAGYKWKMCMYPEEIGGYLSLYLYVVKPRAPAVGWFVDANIVFKIIDQLHPKYSITRETTQTFKKNTLSWGFQSFISHDLLENQEKGFVLNDACVFEIELTVTAATRAPNVISRINQQKPAHEDYLLRLETIDAIHAKARSFLKSSSADDDDHVDKSVVKLLEDAVKAEERIIAKISWLRNRHTEELEAATKEAKELIDQSLDATIDGILDARCALTLASLCTDLDECVKIHKGTTYEDAGGIDKKLDALRKRCNEKSEVARKQVEALIGQRVKASKTTQQFYVRVTNEKVVERSKSKSTLWWNLFSWFKP